jgi:FKBP-type peptidyl-prolyl cis-trans isomerase
VLSGEKQGDHPGAADKVTVHYTGWTSSDGKMFDSSVLRGDPATFGLNQVIAGWTEGLQLITVGQKARFWIPGEMAYGNESVGGRPSGMLVFDVELLSFVSSPKPPPVPEDVGGIPQDACVTASGLAFKELIAGSGTENPQQNSVVTVHYTGWMTNGQMFDSSVVRGETIEFPLDRVIPGWTEGVQLMVKGQTARLWIPAELAYGNEGEGGRPKGMLVFDVQLVDFTVPPAAPEVPDDVSAAPSGATTTASGLAYRVLQAGSGSTHPQATSTVTVHYTGWMTNGEMFDSSVVRGETISFGLNRVIPGWTEGLQTMVTGEKKRFWIPGQLAYGDTPQGGRPYGMLVFDVELFSFE